LREEKKDRCYLGPVYALLYSHGVTRDYGTQRDWRSVGFRYGVARREHLRASTGDDIQANPHFRHALNIKRVNRDPKWQHVHVTCGGRDTADECGRIE